MPGLQILDRAQLGLEGHGWLEAIIDGPAHGGVRLVPIHTDTGAGQFVVNIGTAQGCGGIGQMANHRPHSSRGQATGELLEGGDLSVGRGNELRDVRHIGHCQVAEEPDDVKDTLCRQGA